MGIKQLSRLISNKAPNSIKKLKIDHYFNQIIAIDASMCLYQFLISIRSDNPNTSNINNQLTNQDGKVTSHISGMFYRTINLLESGIKPVFVFDGKPPSLKSDTISERKAIKAKAENELEIAIKMGDKEKIIKSQKRAVRVTKEECKDVINLLLLMGMPVINAPGEAEAECANLCKENLVYGVATEDMDALTFGTPILLRNLLRKRNKNDLINEFKLEAVLEGFGVTMEQFVDICILCGCDYTKTIRGVGPNRAFDLIKKHKNIEAILSLKKYKEETENFKFKESREVFKNPDVTTAKAKLVWKNVDKENLLDFMVNKNGFKKERILTAIERIKKARKKFSQTRLDSYFGVKTTSKRKIEPASVSVSKTKKAKKVKK